MVHQGFGDEASPLLDGLPCTVKWKKCNLAAWMFCLDFVCGLFSLHSFAAPSAWLRWSLSGGLSQFHCARDVLRSLVAVRIFDP